MNLTRTIITICFLQLLSIGSIACSCEKLGRLTKAGLVGNQIAFVGRVIEILQVNDYTMKAVFQVEENLTKLGLSKTIDIYSPLDCVHDFRIGIQWYVFPQNNSGKYFSGICSRSFQLTKKSFSEFKQKYGFRNRKGRNYFNTNRRRAKREITLLRRVKSS